MNEPQATREMFNWRAHIVLGALTPEKRVMLEQALDAIAAAEPEGPTLIRQAHAQLAAGKMVRISEVANIGSYAQQSTGDIGIDFTQAAQLQFSTPDGWRPVSLAGIVTHELFHLADSSTFFDAYNIFQPIELFLDKLVISDTLSGGEKAALALELARAAVPLDGASATQFNMQDIYTRLADPAVHARVAQKLGIDPESFHFSALTPDELTAKYWRSLYESSLLREEKATDFTDAFMHKHFSAEPLRHEYRNGCQFTRLDAAVSVLPALQPAVCPVQAPEVDLFLERILANQMRQLPRLPWETGEAMRAPFPLQDCPNKKALDTREK